MVPRPLDRSGGEAQGEAGGEQNLTRTHVAPGVAVFLAGGGCHKNSRGGVTSTPSICRCRCDQRQLFLPVAEDGIGRFMGDGGSV